MKRLTAKEQFLLDWDEGNTDLGVTKMQRDLENVIIEAQQQVKNCNKADVSSRFSISKTIVSNFALFAIIDNELNKVVCHLVYDNGEQYCDEMANKMLAGLNGC